MRCSCTYSSTHTQQCYCCVKKELSLSLLTFSNAFILARFKTTYKAYSAHGMALHLLTAHLILILV